MSLYNPSAGKNKAKSMREGRETNSTNSQTHTSGRRESSGHKTGESAMSTSNTDPRGVNSETVSEAPEGQAGHIRELVREGMSERLAREEFLGKGWVEP